MIQFSENSQIDTYEKAITLFLDEARIQFFYGANKWSVYDESSSTQRWVPHH